MTTTDDKLRALSGRMKRAADRQNEISTGGWRTLIAEWADELDAILSERDAALPVGDSEFGAIYTCPHCYGVGVTAKPDAAPQEGGAVREAPLAVEGEATELIAALNRLEGIRRAMGGSDEHAQHYQDECANFVTLHRNTLISLLAADAAPRAKASELNRADLATLLVASVNDINAGFAEIRLDGMTDGGNEIGDWVVTVQQSSATPPKPEQPAQRGECNCACHRNPNVKHAIPCCTPSVPAEDGLPQLPQMPPLPKCWSGSPVTVTWAEDGEIETREVYSATQMIQYAEAYGSMCRLASTGQAKVAVPQDVMEARAQGRAEALAIILGLEAEVGLDEYTQEVPPGPAGEWGTAWDEVKLRELLRADDTAWSLLCEAEGEYWHNLGLREEAQRIRAEQPAGGE